MNPQNIRSEIEPRKLKKPLRNVNVEHKESLNKLERIAISVTDRVSTMGFFFIILVWTFLWLIWNITVPLKFRFDPYPAFVIWLLISNMIQLFLMPLIMISQNLQGRYAEARADADFELNTKAELEIETILHDLDNQSELILQILRKINEPQKEKGKDTKKLRS
ncbi:MAG: DUF1003 domain-containing protein [Candidatus Taylorbacteria bacterium]|nr:DUF1003 domain-containing protein [Candidatus Taylorbacteria bacterium]